MELSNLYSELAKAFPLAGAVRVNKEDGEVNQRSGDVTQKLIDIGAFLGSAGEIIAKKMNLQNPEYSVLKSEGLDVIIISDSSTFTVISMQDASEHGRIFEAYMKADAPLVQKEEKAPEPEPAKAESDLSDLADFAQSSQTSNRIGEIERKLLAAKVLQINYLVDEFSQGGSRTEWNNFLKVKFSEIDDFRDAVDIGDKIELHEVIPTEISRDSIQVNTKSLIDAVCKMAVEKYGAAEAKKMVQNVITKLNKR